jgi:NADPH:quinone reductase-like Zn-dependent oxidoreductase
VESWWIRAWEEQKRPRPPGRREENELEEKHRQDGGTDRAPKPATLTFEQAAVLAISGLTALQSLRDHGRVETEQRVLVIGASGGVGAFAVQIARAYDAHVTGVYSTTKVEMVRSIGADHVIDYTREDFADSSRRWHVILDIGGSSALRRVRRALTPQGTLIIVGGEGGGLSSRATVGSEGGAHGEGTDHEQTNV